MGPPEELEAAHIYLKRAAACPIEVVVSVHNETFADVLDTTGWRQLSTSLVGRCWRLLIHIPSDTHERAMRRYLTFLGPLRAPFLTSFEITRNLNSDHGPEAETAEVLTGGAPMLHSVRLANPNPGGCHPPLSHVTVMRLMLPHAGFYCECVYRIPKSLPCLTHLELQGADIFSTWPANLPAVYIPLLRTLSLASQSSRARVYHVLHAITAPYLDTLCIRGFEALHDLEAQSLPEFKFPALRSLVWVTEGRLGQTRCDFPTARIPHPVRGLFKAFSSVERLVCGGPYANELPRFLKEADVAGDLCWRQLRVIALQCLAPPAVSIIPEYTDDEAHELMARRRAVGVPIDVAFFSSSLAWPWTMFDTEYPDVQEYLDVLDDAEAGR